MSGRWSASLRTRPRPLPARPGSTNGKPQLATRVNERVSLCKAQLIVDIQVSTFRPPVLKITPVIPLRVSHEEYSIAEGVTERDHCKVVSQLSSAYPPPGNLLSPNPRDKNGTTEEPLVHPATPCRPGTRGDTRSASFRFQGVGAVDVCAERCSNAHAERAGARAR
jgi:hypothetical protein